MIFDSIPLPVWSLFLAALFLVPAAVNLFAPDRAVLAAKAFPRSRGCDWILSAMAFLWAAALVFSLPIDFLARIRVPVMVLIIVAIPLSWAWMPDLLGSRAIGGLLVLLPAPVLQIARYCDSTWRLVVIVLMYLFAVAGMVLVLYPYHLRDALSWIAARPTRIRAVGIVCALLGLLLLLLGLVVF